MYNQITEMAISGGKKEGGMGIPVVLAEVLNELAPLAERASRARSKDGFPKWTFRERYLYIECYAPSARSVNGWMLSIRACGA